jgi:chemotaxis protein methyltransferase CheR
MGARHVSARGAASDLRLDAGYDRLKNLIIERTGHHYYADKDDALFDRLRRRFQATRARDCTDYLTLLEDPERGAAEWSRLEAEITIGETFFFRYTEQFAALRGTILPELLARNREDRRIRVWSAGCSTGAEPYSVAILLADLLGDAALDWRISIVGTDISDTALDAARGARYGKWALRSMPSDERARYFSPADKDRWQLRPAYRSMVRFERHNLLSLLDGTSPLQFTDFDLVLCRNVLIYFHPDTVLRVVGALRDCLAEEGWLLLGHAEPSPAFASLLRAIHLPGTAAYRRPIPDAGAPATEVPSVRAPDPPRTPPPPRARTGPVRPPARAGVSFPERARPGARPPLPAPSGPEAILREIRAKANAGLVSEARALCALGLRSHPVNAELYFYEGLLAQAADLHLEAEKSFRRSIYVDKSFVMAHYHLGLLLLANGRQGPGSRSLANAARLASASEGECVLTEGDGVTAAELRELVRLHLEGLARTGAVR